MNAKCPLLSMFPFRLKSCVLALLFMSLGYGGLFADWKPEYLTEGGDEFISLDVLQDKKFQMLKSKVAKYLTNSWCSQEKAELLMDLVLVKKPAVCVEIGACTGSTVLPVAATLKHLGRGKVFAIDAWSNEVAVRNWDENDPNRPWWSQVSMDTLQKMFHDTLTTWGLHPYCTTLRMTSEKAADQIPNNIEFLHLDGDYSEIGSMQDVELYLPKVKSGGYILLSGFYTMVNNKQPKLKSFCALFDACDVVAEIEHDNAILFRKQ